jgi:hypothetical protein
MQLYFNLMQKKRARKLIQALSLNIKNIFINLLLPVQHLPVPDRLKYDHNIRIR